MIERISELCGAPSLHSFVHGIELKLVDDSEWSAPDEHGYLTDDERADPEIAANIEAMARTNKLIWWIGQDFEGFIGLWRGPLLIFPADAPIVRLDTEGQYNVVATNFPDYLLASVFDDEFDAARAALVGLGADSSVSLDRIRNAVDALRDADDFVDPNEFHNDQYSEIRASHND